MKIVVQQYQQYDRLSKAWLNNHTGKVYCHAGCFHCCNMPIRVSLLEALALAATLSPEQAQNVAHHATKVLLNARNSQNMAQYIHQHRTRVGYCPLLISGSCSVYELRPIRCRDTYSALPETYCQVGTQENFTPSQRTAYLQKVRSITVTDGHSHYIAPLEDLSLPMWQVFSQEMRKAWGFEVWGDFHVLLSMALKPELPVNKGHQTLRHWLKKHKLYHPEIVEVF